MKPFRPYADYYVGTNNLQNCRQNSSANVSACRYIRKTGTCGNLNQTEVYQNADFTNKYEMTTNVTVTSSQIISTNCAILDTQNYNPGIENTILSLGATFTALLFISLIIFACYQVIRKIPPLWRK